ncbi:Glycosyltransferase involved in cell wall bisynthesis [Carboxydocella sporoproducens DSM 16521]|uniref:Glycosyltransferase involved in cell wall bisynthesis n=2 Tax=Carboxydocella TaxID=178898 RepID=A0A1T4P1Y6_9FIRM|nr:MULTISPECIES: glycosyltransferase family 4 protein [Carboxydocella]AVX19587.1 Glycosyltransferase involved in cell wall bisynthesis [Carboxydocella thermautotrophica]AVX30002.1 Glycosyltransferase involved in cell wall bisynthesis [Carboxydocella thermautotrophica]SJZ85276.1 Glycosyltransferase involved in cell wall bisynthesis [Carboxydocella sporoproducens DSM 16521]
MTRVVFLRSNPVFPDPRVEKEAQSLSELGYQVTIVCWDRIGNLPIKEKYEFGEIQRLTIKAPYGKGLKNFANLLIWQFSLFKWLIRNNNKYDIIHACDFDTVLPAMFIKFIKNVNVIYDIFDFYADMVRNVPNSIKKIIKRIDYCVINKVDGVIIADENRLEQINGCNPKRIVVIYNSPPDFFNELKLKYDKKDKKFRIAYIGILQKERGLLEMIDVVKKNPNWHLDIAGFGGDEQLILKEILDANNIIFHGRLDYLKALELSSQADVLFATYDPDVINHRYSSPNKLFEAMMLGKPIIVCEGTGMDKLVVKHKMGLIVKYGNKHVLEKALNDLYNNRELYNQLSYNSRKTYENYFSWQKNKIKLQKFYKDIINN